MNSKWHSLGKMFMKLRENIEQFSEKCLRNFGIGNTSCTFSKYFDETYKYLETFR